MEILQLRYFYESSKNENFARTAEKFMVPTSSVSASVKRLEQELGCSLFDRFSNRIMLNKNGKRLQQSLCVILNELDQVVEDLSTGSDDNREIKMLVRSMRSKITDCIIVYSTKYPHAAFKTAFDFRETNFENYDIIIDEKTDRYPEYESFEFCNLRLRLTVAANSPLCGRKLTLKQLCNQPFITIGEQSNMQNILLRACRQAGFTPNIAVQSNDIKCLDKLIASGIGIGLSREFPLEKNSDIAFLDVTDFNERYTVYSYYKKKAAYGNVQHFLNFLKNNAI
ncbi:MAG: LysR family transcriptional regulator [Clostridia bacterium]|nr:LysR family transcriptional regulator [Clostridia bacterium]